MRPACPRRCVWSPTLARLASLFLILAASTASKARDWIKDPAHPTPVFGQSTGGGFSRIEALVRQPDGKLLMQGTFASINGTKTLAAASSSFVRINVDGTLDPTFQPEEITVGGLKRTWVPRLVQPSGKIIVDDGVSPFARLNTDGTVDPTFQSLGRPTLLFTTGPFYALTAPGQIQRFTADGAPDPSFTTLNIPTLTLHGVAPDGRIVGSVAEGSGRRFIWFSKDGAELYRATSLHGSAIFGVSATSYQARVLPDGSVLCYGNAGDIYDEIVRFFRFSSQGVMTQLADIPAETFTIADVIDDQLMQAGGGDLEVQIDTFTDRADFLFHNHEAIIRPLSFLGGLREYFPLTRLTLKDPAQPVAAYTPYIYHLGFGDEVHQLGEQVVVSGAVYGSYPRSYQFFRDGVALAPALASTLPLPGFVIKSFQASDVGSYTLVVTTPEGTITSKPVKLSLFESPVIKATPPSITVSPGQTVALTLTTTGSVNQYSYSRSNLFGDSSYPTPATAGSYTLLLAGDSPNVDDTYTFHAGSRYTPAISSGPVRVVVSRSAKPSRLSNVSVRTFVGTGDKHLFLGFVTGGVKGGGRMPLLIRGIGPALADFGVAGAISDPVIALHQGDPIINSNNNWQGNNQVAAISAFVGAFPLTNPASLDAALYLAALPTGTYTAEIFGSSTRITGIALAEIYDATVPSDQLAEQPRLVNLSCRAQVDGIEPLITGFVIAGETAKTLLVRAIGPGLKDFGVTGTLPAGQLTIFNSAGQTVAAHISGQINPVPGLLAPRVGAFAARENEDNALAVTLPPGAYTAQVRGVGGAAGVVLVEIYEVP